ncbi:MAG TPA: TIGR04283 family arsenosugar biosynthesis glycosyltransferase [Burkholderiales bacterium]|nr:TIGR04283 family arsenosugar biosynthesis glycosyltransferase [Burkholderiales bacterium]
MDAGLKLSIVIPALNEAERIEAALQALAPLRRRGCEVIVVDGGSADRTRELAAPLCDRILSSARGRAVQMNAGAHHASGEALLFLHVDTFLPPDGDFLVGKALENHLWGRFDVEIEGRRRLLKVVACAMNLRSRLSGIATGDQAIFVRRDAFPGFAAIALMEDIAFSQEMKRRGAPACLRERVRTSGRRWERRGVLRTVVLMWRLRLLYYFGAPPERLARLYEP